MLVFLHSYLICVCVLVFFLCVIAYIYNVDNSVKLRTKCLTNRLNHLDSPGSDTGGRHVKRCC